MEPQKRKALITLFTFLCSLCLFYFIGYWLIYRMGQATPLMLSVGAATVATCLIRNISVRDLGWHWGEHKYQALSYLVPLIIISLSYLLIWFAGFADWYNTEFVSHKKESYNLPDWSDLSVIIFHIALTASISFIVSLPSILGEEIGWRGLLTSELGKLTSFSNVAIISGLLWSAWHYPLILLGLYGNQETPMWFQLICFTAFISANGVIMAYLRFKTNSLWTAVIYHMSSNIFIQKIFTPLSVTHNQSSWYIDEFGAVLAVVATLVAIYFWRKGVSEFDTKEEN